MQFFYKRSSSPISMSLLYFSTRSPLDGPTLMKLEFTSTAKSTMKVSFVSPPPLLLTIVSILFFLASMQQSTVSVRVPIWFSLISIAFIALSFIAFSILFMFVTVRSSPMIFILLPNFLVISVQLSQSSSAKGSSRVMRLYFFAQFSKYLIISDDDSEIFSGGKYSLSKEKKELSSSEMIRYFENWAKKYNLITLEDPLAEDDWESWTEITKKLGNKIKIIGDDLTVTNIKRLEKAIKLKAINAILIKLNQIGTLTETVDCCMLARKNKMDTIVSHRGGGETNDTFMVDLAVAVNSSFIKVGPSRGERVEKYNRLMEIGEELRL